MLLPWLTLAVIFAVIYLGSAFSPGLLDDADSTHAEAAREMLAGADFVTLHVNGVRYLEKAPLPYWLVALSYRAFGLNEFATRLPNMPAVFFSMMLAAVWGKRAFGRRAGIYAGLFVCTSLGFFLFTRIFIPDALLSLLIASSFYFFLSALDIRASNRWYWYAVYTALALAVLTKGLVALVLFGVTAILFLTVTGEWRRWRDFRLPSGLLLFVAIAAPWHVLAAVRNHSFLWFYFVNEHLLRFLGRRYPADYQKLPLMLYWSLHLVWLFPWILFLPLAIRRSANNNAQGLGAEFARRTRLLCWIWSGVVLIFFSFSTNQEYYTFPAYIPLLLLAAEALARNESSQAEADRNKKRRLLFASTACALVCAAAASALLAGLWASRHLPSTADVGSLLVDRNVAGNTLSMSRFFDLTAAAFAGLRLPALMAVLALLLMPGISLWLRARSRHYAATWTLALGMSFLLVAAHLALVRFGPYLSSEPLATAIARQLREPDKVAIYGDQAYGSSLLFYLKRPIYLVNGRTTSMWFGSTFADAPHIYLDDHDLFRMWKSPERVFLFVPANQRQHVDQMSLAVRYVVAESSGKIIYSNRAR